MPSVAALLADATARLTAAGIDEARGDARLLLAAATGWDAAILHAFAERDVAPETAAAFEASIARRAARAPVGRILGRRGFWTLDLALGPDTLEPRPDTETLVEAALAAFPIPPARIVDLGTGTGALLLALLSEWPRTLGLGIDIAPGAAAVARANAATHGLADRAHFVVADWTAALGGPVDLVVCNPPYVETGAALAPEVADHDPARALFAGADGLDDHRRLWPDLARHLAPGGTAILEIGAAQGPAATALARAAGFAEVRIRQDLGGLDRAVVASLPR